MEREEFKEKSERKLGLKVAGLDANKMPYGEIEKMTSKDLNRLIMKKSLDNERLFM